MRIVLNSDVKKLGYRGDVVKVKNGYFRNFLHPRGLADIATLARLKLAELRKNKIVMQRQQLLDNAKDVLAKLHGLKVIIKVKASKKGKLYGAIAQPEVIEAIFAATNVKLAKDLLKMEHLKEVGDHKIKVHLGEDLEETVTVVVEAL